MSYLADPYLTYIPREIKRLEQEVSDAEWENDPRLTALVSELNHLKEQMNDGKLYEPRF
jgi:hypothetical protein